MGPPVVSEHLVGQADHAVPLDVADLEEFSQGGWSRGGSPVPSSLASGSAQTFTFCPPPATLELMYSGPSLCFRALCTAWCSSAVYVY